MAGWTVMSPVHQHNLKTFKNVLKSSHRPPPSVDRLVGRQRGRRRPLTDADADCAQQQEDHGSSQTDRHDGEDQRGEGVDGRRARAHQHGPETELSELLIITD